MSSCSCIICMRGAVGRAARTPSLTVAKPLLSAVADRGLVVMPLDIERAFLLRRTCTSSCPSRTPKSSDELIIRTLKNAMCGARVAPQKWGGTVKEQMVGMVSEASGLHPAVEWHEKRGTTVVVHVDDVLCIGAVDSLSLVRHGQGAVRFEGAHVGARWPEMCQVLEPGASGGARG